MSLLLLTATADAGLGEESVAQSIESLIDALDSTREGRADARARLVELGPAATTALLARRHDISMVRRWEIVTVLGMAGDPSALDELALMVVTDVESHVRWRSIWAIRSYPPVTTRKTSTGSSRTRRPSGSASSSAAV